MPLFVLPPCIFAELCQESRPACPLPRHDPQLSLAGVFGTGQSLLPACVFCRVPEPTQFTRLIIISYSRTNSNSASGYSHKIYNSGFIQTANRLFCVFRASPASRRTVHSDRIPEAEPIRYPHRCTRCPPTRCGARFCSRTVRTSSADRSHTPRRFSRSPRRSDNRRYTRDGVRRRC